MNSKPSLSSVLMLWGLLALPAASLAHSGDDGHVTEYDPVENEFGSYGPEMKSSRVIKVDMNDNMRFSPERIKVKVGEVIRFEHTNTGKLMHEFVLGTGEYLTEHAEMMKKFPNMEHDEPYMAHVAPGKTASMLWKFDKPGVYNFGCLIPGHFDAGMKGEVVVE
jgi:uncharacterized cupredoxin-like copper-binding protein